MSRPIKIILNLFISSLVFNYFVLILTLLLNSYIRISFQEFFYLFSDLYIFYGPLWIIFNWIIYLIVVFFSDKKLPIGVLTPPTLTYFLSFTVLIISAVLFANYDYYLNFIGGKAKTAFIRILLMNLGLVITGIVFIFYKRINKKWLQVFFLTAFAINMIYSYQLTGTGQLSTSLVSHPISKSKTNTSTISPAPGTLSLPQTSNASPRQSSPRKIRIVLMDGISLDLITSLASEQKLLNFNEVINRGVSGRINCFSPNLSLSLVNSALTGLHPSQFSQHSNEKFTFMDLNDEFDVRPRFIFFRKTPFIGITTFYNKHDITFLDNLQTYYRAAGRKTAQLTRPLYIDAYSDRTLYKNDRFAVLFPDIVLNDSLKDPKYEILKKHFFFDDYIKNMLPPHKDDNLYYSVLQLPGLEYITRNFYQYHIPQVFGGISQDNPDIKKYGHFLEKYYSYYDSIVGNLLSNIGDDELLIILSFFEYEPLPLWRRILVHLFGENDVYVYIPLQAQGTFLMYEKNALKQGYPSKNISIYDIYPTLLYYSGFSNTAQPNNSRGTIVKDIFSEKFLLNHPIAVNNDEDI